MTVPAPTQTLLDRTAAEIEMMNMVLIVLLSGCVIVLAAINSYMIWMMFCGGEELMQYAREREREAAAMEAVAVTDTAPAPDDEVIYPPKVGDERYPNCPKHSDTVIANSESSGAVAHITYSTT